MTNNETVNAMRWIIAALWIVLTAASLYAFAEEPASDAPEDATAPAKAPETAEALSPETQQTVDALKAALPEDSEAMLMLSAILEGSQLGPGEGWFAKAVSQTRYPWDVVRRRYDADEDGKIVASEFPGAEGDFARLDRNRDEELTDDDFDWSESGIPRTPGAMLFYQADADSNGKLTREEFAAVYDAWDKEGIGFLALDDIRDRFSPPGRRGAGDDGPTKDMLIRGLQRQEIGSHQPGPSLDEPAPDFTLTTFDGKETVTLSQQIGLRPVVLVFGNFTCGPFRAQAGNIEKLYRRYGDRAAFLLVYVREAHPRDGWKMDSNERRGVDLPQPATYEERVAVAAACRERLALELPFLVDTIDDAVGARYSGMPSRLYLIDREGRIAFKSGRGPFGFQPAELEQALVLLLAESESK